nr:hypothetical protein [Tanacetum cinerariifolium]
MCKELWGRSSFARCLIEINSEAGFMESITIGIPDLEGPSYTKKTIRVNYEWKPPRCSTCNVFGHTDESCPKKVVTNPIVTDNNASNVGFKKVVNRKRKNKGSSAGNKIPKGVPVSNGFQVGKEFAFQPKAPNVGSTGSGGTRGETSSKASSSKSINEDALSNTKGTNYVQQETGKKIFGQHDTGKKISNISSPNLFAVLGEDEDEDEEVRRVVNENNLSVCAILESYVDVAVVYDTCKKVCRSWKWTSNRSLCSKEGFCEIVDSGWSVNVDGFTMYRVVKHLKGLKSLFRKLPHDHGNLHERVNKIHIELDKSQKAIDRDPSSSTLRDEHAYYLLAFQEAQLDEERFLKQKAKVKWLKAGDSNTTYFHRIVKSKCAKDRIEMFLGAEGVTNPLDDHDLYIYVLDLHKAVLCKIIANRVKDGFDDIVSINQSAFVHGRGIFDNILLTQELMRNYHRRRGPLRCAFKVLVFTLLWSIGLWFAFLLPLTLSALMATCTVSLRDDLFLFARGHPTSVSVIMDALEEFKQVSGLVPSIPKSTAYFFNVSNAIKAYILNLMPFVEGSLLSPLIIWSVLSSMHIYWASVFILPSRIVHDLEQLMRGFLWCQGEMKKGKSKFAWESVCMPKQEGGLGIRKIDDFNIALIYIWCILTHKESLCVKWVHTYKLKGRCFWDVPCRGDFSWGWRKLLQIRYTIRTIIWHKINNGKSTSVWFDRWADVSPLKDTLSHRDIARLGFSLTDSVSNLNSDDVWRWPPDWLSSPSWWLVCGIRFDPKLFWFIGTILFGFLIVFPVWSKVRVMCGMDAISPRFIDITAFIVPISKDNTVISILSRIVIAATSYYIWELVDIVKKTLEFDAQGVELGEKSLEIRRYARLVEVHTAYWEFPGVGTTFNSFQNLHIFFSRCMELDKHFIRTNIKPKWMVLRLLLVLPPDLRPICHIDEDKLVTSDINEIYRRIIYQNNTLTDLLTTSIAMPEELIISQEKLLQEAVDALLNNGI